MADDLTLPGTGTKVDTFELTDTSHRQKVAIMGAGDNEQDVIGATDETAASSDTATSGLNGRLQRIAQRLTSLIALFPSALTGGGNFKAAIVESTATVTVQSNGADLATEATLGTAAASIGATNESAAGTDTATSGLNGLVKRLLQRVTALIALFPAALTGSGNFKTALQEAIPAGTNNIGDVDIASIAAGEAHLGEVGGKTIVLDLTLSLDTSAYTSGDVMADTQQCDAFFRKADGTGVIQSIVVIDEDDQKQAFDIHFFSANRSLGTENSAPSISDANARDHLGVVSVSASDYKDIGGVSIATIRNIGLPVMAVSGTDDLYVGTIIGGTATYTASGVRLRIGALLD